MKKKSSNVLDQKLDPASIRVWGIGLGRTGTTSLADALRILGFTPCVHNPTFNQLAEIRSGTDNGVTVFFKYLDYRYPGSKFILTKRPLNSWLRSIESMTGYKKVSRDTPDEVILRQTLLYGTMPFDRRAYIRTYRRHHKEVRRYFAKRPDDLLELDITGGEGWEKLCRFLGCGIPGDPFPHRNSRNSVGVLRRKTGEFLFRWGFGRPNLHRNETR